jgi:outer membrane protein
MFTRTLLVAQTCSLLYRRFVIGRTPANPDALDVANALQAASPRCGRLQICATFSNSLALCRQLWPLFASVLLLASSWSSVRAQTDTNLLAGFTLEEVIQRVLDHNESVQMEMLEAEISRKVQQAERAIFEPQVVGSVERIDSQRPNNTQQLLSLGFSATPELNERNTLYNGGLEFLLPTGARLRAGYTLRRLSNNLQRGQGAEYETFIGTSLVQPLLKNFGPAATMVRIRLAALASDIAFQEYRRQLMLILSQAEAAYWDLYLMQEQERISGESVVLAGKLFEDNRVRRDVGKAPELEVLQAQAGLSLRQSRQNEARLKVFEGANRLSALYSDVSIQTNSAARVLDKPALRSVSLAHFDNYDMAYRLNPDYLIRQKQAEQEGVRVKYARNQRLPQVDLKASYGFNGLGESVGASWGDVTDREFPSWSLGVEMRIPVTGGIRERRELEAAKLSQARALAGLREAEVQIANTLESAIRRVNTHVENVQSYQAVVDFHQKLLEALLDRLEVGSIDSRTVLETEEKLFEAKIDVVESLVLYRKALLELELIRGSTLQTRNLDLTKSQLQAKTTELLQSERWTEQTLESYQNQALQQLEPNARNQSEAQRVLRDKMRELRRTSVSRQNQVPQSPVNQAEALRVLRQRMQELKETPPPQPKSN